MDSKEIKPVNLKGNRPWIFNERTVAEAEAAILWPPDTKSQLIGKDPDAGKHWRQKEKGPQRMRWSDSITDSMDMNLSKHWEIVKNRGAWCTTVHSVTKSCIWLSDGTTTKAHRFWGSGKQTGYRGDSLSLLHRVWALTQGGWNS